MTPDLAMRDRVTHASIRAYEAPRSAASDVAWARRWLAGVQYRPGWSLEVADHASPTGGRPGGALRLMAYVPDARAYVPNHREQVLPMVQVGLVIPLPHNLGAWTRTEFLEWVYLQLQGLEEHEAREWWVVDGERPLDPHKAP